jgi:glycoprotein endo-alpha-1,2-mannosidase
MRRLLLIVLVALALPAAARADVRVTAFYYPWYGTASTDGAYLHWSQDGHSPPDNIASSYYPAIGIYSSADRLVLSTQMQEIRSADIDQIAVSWWGRGSVEDKRLPAVVAAARAQGIAVAAHIEPYGGRSVASIVTDVAYLRTLGVTTFYVYRALDLPIADWAAARGVLHQSAVLMYAQTDLPGAAAAAGFDGIYTYDIVTFSGDKFARLCAEARKMHLLCAPSVGPGYDARRGSGDPRVKPRRNGATYDHMWRSAITAHADQVTITSFNEWHEGTQIEPAALPSRHGAYRYLSYNGAWGLSGIAAEGSYLERTAYWVQVFRRTSAPQPNTIAP